MGKYSFKNLEYWLLGAGGLLGLGYGLAMHTKLAKVSERLDKGIDELSGRADIDIPFELVKKAVENAASVEAKKAVEKATDDAMTELKNSIHETVSDTVNKEYATIKDSVLKKATDEAAKIDAARVRRDIEKAAYDTAMSKFNDNLDDILDKFNDNLNNTSKIYSSIAGAMTKPADSGKEFVFKLG